MKKRYLIGGIVAVPCVLLLGAFAMTGMAGNAIEFEPVKMDEIVDGTYLGEASAGIVSAKVSVAVNHHRIEDITLIQHEHGMGEKAEDIIQTMISENTTDVDAISGATISSHVIRKAIENALIQAH